jgi:hypothetical protein
MAKNQSCAAILLAGERVSFWQFLGNAGNAVVAYVVAILAMFLGGPLGALACMLIGTATTFDSPGRQGAKKRGPRTRKRRSTLTSSSLRPR